MNANLNRLFDAGLSGFVFSSALNRETIPDAALGVPLEFVNSDDPARLRFAVLFNIINGVAFGGAMGMPPWVLVDCVLAPSIVAGVQGPARLVAPELRAKIDFHLQQYLDNRENSNNGETSLGQMLQNADLPAISGPLRDDEIIPLAEYCALPSFTSGNVIGMSLYNICSGQGDYAIKGLGRVAKALGLAVYQGLGATQQIGITQYENRSLATHTCFGPLEIVQAITPLHTKADRTFTYKLTIPAEADLAKIAAGESLQWEPLPTGIEVVRPGNTNRIREMNSRLRAGTHRYFVVAPGYDREQGGACVLERTTE